MYFTCSSNYNVSKEDCIELYDLYVSLRCQLDAIRLQSTLSLEDYKPGLRVVEEHVRRTIEYDNRLVEVNLL